MHVLPVAHLAPVWAMWSLYVCEENAQAPSPCRPLLPFTLPPALPTAPHPLTTAAGLLWGSHHFRQPHSVCHQLNPHNNLRGIFR